MSKQEPNPYFAMQRGRRVMMGDIKHRAAETIPAVRAFVSSGEIVGQYTLPDDRGRTDIQVWMPARIKEIEKAANERLQEVREELRAISNGQNPKEHAPKQVRNGHVLQQGIPVDLRVIKMV